jgi:hypothetical protein
MCDEEVVQPAVVFLKLRHPGERDVPDVPRVFHLAETELEHRPDRRHGVLESDLLPLVVRPPVVGDRDLEEAIPAARDLRRDLRLDAEAGRLDGERLDHLAPEDLVAGLHVREIQVGQHVRDERQHPVPDGVPEVEDAALSPAEKTRAVHHVGAPRLDRVEQSRVVHGVVLEVGVLDDDEVPAGFLEAAGDRRALPAVLRWKKTRTP